MNKQNCARQSRSVYRRREETAGRRNRRSGPARGLPAALAAVLTMASVVAWAQDPADLEQCHAIPDASGRLACYDRVSGREIPAPDTGPAAATVSVPEQSSGEDAGARQQAASAEPHEDRHSILDASWGFTEDSNRYPISMYHPNYILPLRYTSDVNNEPFSPVFEAGNMPDQKLDAAEAKFQLSLKARFWATDDKRWGLWVAYTQQNQWQIYNDEISRPFRETNYMPEVFASYRPDLQFAGFEWKLLNAGYTHQSNGRTDPLSRSWDRIFAEVGFERGNLALMLRAWARIEESADEDDNPDITDYYGHTELNALYRWGNNSLALMGRGNFDTGKGAIQAGWFSPPLVGPLRGYVQVFSGYGESMIDYNWNQTTIGIGLALSDGL